MRHRIRQLGQGIAALVATVLLTGGVPAVLVRYVGWPLPTQLPGLDEIQLALRSGIDPQLVVNTIAVVVWLIWLQLMVTLTVEAAAVVRGKTAAALPVLPGLQQTAARLVATITLVTASLAPIKAPPAAALPLGGFVSEPTTITEIALVVPYVDQSDLSSVPARPTNQGVTYTTRRFDSLWGIAERAMGDGRRWDEILHLNPDRVTGDGHVGSGIHLLLPADATLPKLADSPRQVTVKRGDHLWSIAESALADAWSRHPTADEVDPYWRQIIDTNRDRLAPPYDPSLIYPGQVFDLPPIPPNPQAEIAASDDAVADVTGVTVAPGDHFWSIAESALAEAWGRQPTVAEIDGYWGEVIDTNRDRLQRADDPSYVLPGQVFLLPAIPADPTMVTSAADEPGTQPQTVSPDWPPASELNPPPETAGETVTESTALETSGPPATTPPVPEEPEAAPGSTESAGTDADLADDDGGLLPIAVRVAGLGILAAGLVALIDRLRRGQLQHRKPGTVPTPPPESSRRVEETLRSAASLPAADLVDTALRALARLVIDTQIPVPHTVGVHLSEEDLKVLLWTPHPDPPRGWRADDDGASWSLPTATDVTHLRLLADGTPAPNPAMVTAGHDDNSQLLVDLEFLGAVQVSGDGDEVLATCYTIATELAASPIADHLQVVCVGFGSDLADLERVTVVDNLNGHVLDEVESKVSALANVEGSPLEARLAPGGEDWYPVIVVDPASTAPDGADRLLAAALAGRGVAAVVGYPTGDRWRFHLTGGTVDVEPLGFTLTRRNLTPTEQQGVAELVSTAKNLDGVPPGPVEPAASSNGHHPDPTAASRSVPIQPHAVDSDADLEVRVLGTIRIDRLTATFPSRKAAELPVYLALHRDGAEADTLMEALWPDEAPDYNRFNRTTSRARTTLGEGSDGSRYLPRFSGGLYRVSPRLGCDLDRFTDQVNQANQADGAEQIRHLQAALEKVEGTPFAGAGNGYTWAWAEGLVSHAIVAVDNAAHNLAGAALDSNDPDLAAWAARKGLLSTTRCEECYRNLMRAAIAQDNQTALDAIFAELNTVIDSDDGPDALSYLDTETIELYEQHSRRPTGR